MKNILFSIALLLVLAQARAQRNPVELLVGDQRISADVTLAKALDEKGNWVLFNRTRYHVPHDESQKPTFGTSLGVLYKLKGGIYAGFLGSANSQESVLRTGFYGRYAKGDFSVRSVILTVELRQNPSLDSWAIAQYSPKLSKKMKLFSQVEIAGKLNTSTGIQQSAVRSRLGLGVKNMQFGIANDWEQKYLHSSENETHTAFFSNTALFFRMEV
jgi:hypothetical protein